MKTTVTVTASQPFEWKGQTYMVGDTVLLTPLDAVVLAKKHKVSLTKRKAVLLQSPAPAPVIETPKRGRYRRRDLRAEETEASPPVVVQPKEGTDADSPAGVGDSTVADAPPEATVWSPGDF